MLCCIGGVCVPYTAVVPLVLLVFRWCLAKLAMLGLLPSTVVEMLNLKQFDEQQKKSPCCEKEGNTTTSKDSTTGAAACCGSGTGPSVVKELESDEEFDELLQRNGKVAIKFTAR
jgi:hypothetical protein